MDIDNIVNGIVDSYEKYEDITKIDRGALINKNEVIKVIDLMQKILFPGFFEQKKLKSEYIKYYVGDICESIKYILNSQMVKVFRCSEDMEDMCHEQMQKKADEITDKFMNKIPEIIEYLDTDVQAAYEGDPAAYSIDEIIFSYPGIYAIMVSRIAHELYLLDVPLIPRIMTEHAHSKTGIDIHPGASIGKYFFIDHGTGIVIGETTIIGEHVKIYQGVTLGGLSTRGGQSLKGTKRHPNIEDYVTIYSGASILGGETTIGKGTVVGGNAFITESVSENTKVVVKSPKLNYISSDSEK